MDEKKLAACIGSLKKAEEAFRKLGSAHDECADECRKSLEKLSKILNVPESSKYAWAITKDHLVDQLVGTVGPVNSPLDFAEIIKHYSRQYFKMRDDDDNLYYEGYYVCLDEEFDDPFAPLDDFGTPNAGAVHIAYRQEDGTFKDL